MSTNISQVGAIASATRSKMLELIEASAAAGHAPWHVWGAGGGEHSAPPGLALDLMVRSKADGDWLYGYIWRNRARLRLRHVIWWQTITSTVVSPGVRRPMADRGSVTQNHKDHLHLLFFAGDYQAPAGAAAKPPAAVPAPAGAPPKFPLPAGSYFGPKTGPASSVSGYHGHRKDLRRWQQRMRERGWSITPDGYYGPETARVARQFQAEKRLGVDGLIGPATWDAAFRLPVT